MTREQKLAIYDNAVSRCIGFERVGKTMPYTAANGRMFSQMNKDNELGIRFGKEEQEELINELGTGLFKSYGSVMKGYVLMPEYIWESPERISTLLKRSHAYVLSLEPK